MKRILLFGAPGAGKGSVASLLSARLSFPTISTGDLVRAEIRGQTEIGREVQEIIALGELVPDRVIIGMLARRLDQADVKSGYILDGFPRTPAQAQALASLPADEERAIFLEAGEDVVVERLLARLTCQKCGAIYNRKGRMPAQTGICDLCGGTVTARSDDNEASIRQRLQVYLRETQPVIDYYQQKGLLRTIDGVGTVEEVFARLLKVLA